MQVALPAALAAALTILAVPAWADPQTEKVDFSTGTEGWVGLPRSGFQGSWITPRRGETGAGWRTRINDTFGLTFRNDSNAAFVGDYTSSPAVTLGIDINALSITYFGSEVSRDLVVELRDYDNPAEGMPYTSVWHTLGTLAAGNGWQHFAVTIGDTASAALPDGWQGYGDVTGDPQLPPGRSFASVLRGVDEIVFTTFVPGWFYGFTAFDVVVDNITISAVPEPASAALWLAGLGLAAGVARRRSGRAGAAVI